MAAEPTHNTNIDEYLDPEVLQGGFEEQMEFEPPDFQNVYQ